MESTASLWPHVGASSKRCALPANLIRTHARVNGERWPRSRVSVRKSRGSCVAQRATYRYTSDMSNGQRSLEVFRVRTTTVIRLNRPEHRNAIDQSMATELLDAARTIADDESNRALVIAGAGKAFSAGGDVDYFRRCITDPEIDVKEEIGRQAEVLHSAIVALHNLPVPVIAAIDGPAVGGGFSLALAADYRIASPHAFMQCGFSRIAATPDAGMSWFLARLVGAPRSFSMLLEDARITAQEAHRAGLVDLISDEESSAYDAALEVADRWAQHSPHYLRTVKSLAQSSLSLLLVDQLRHEARGIVAAMDTPELHQRLGIG